IVPHFLHQLHSEFLVRHFPAAKLQLHAHLVAAVEELLAVADFREVIVVVDVYPELDLFQFRPGSLLILILLGDVVTELSEIDDLADRRVRRGRDLDQIETETLSFAQRVREFHDAELVAGGSHDDPHLAGANPTVYTNLLLQIKSKLQTSDAGSEPWRRIYLPHFFRAIAGSDTSASSRLRTRDDEPAFREPTGSSKQHLCGSKANLHRSHAAYSTSSCRRRLGKMGCMRRISFQIVEHRVDRRGNWFQLRESGKDGAVADFA